MTKYLFDRCDIDCYAMYFLVHTDVSSMGPKRKSVAPPQGSGGKRRQPIVTRRQKKANNTSSGDTANAAQTTRIYQHVVPPQTSTSLVEQVTATVTSSLSAIIAQTVEHAVRQALQTPPGQEVEGHEPLLHSPGSSAMPIALPVNDDEIGEPSDELLSGGHASHHSFPLDARISDSQT